MIVNTLNAFVPPASAGVAMTENVLVPAVTLVISMETLSLEILNGAACEVVYGVGEAELATKAYVMALHPLVAV